MLQSDDSQTNDYIEHPAAPLFGILFGPLQLTVCLLVFHSTFELCVHLCGPSFSLPSVKMYFPPYRVLLFLLFVQDIWKNKQKKTQFSNRDFIFFYLSKPTSAFVKFIYGLPDKSWVNLFNFTPHTQASLLLEPEIIQIYITWKHEVGKKINKKNLTHQPISKEIQEQMKNKRALFHYSPYTVCSTQFNSAPHSLGGFPLQLSNSFSGWHCHCRVTPESEK